jgi:anti-sigma factor RsiW
MNPKPHLTCREVVDFLLDYLDGDLPEGVVRQFERHLAGCRDCANFLTTYRATIALAGSAMHACDGDAADEQFPEDLVVAILEARR